MDYNEYAIAADIFQFGNNLLLVSTSESEFLKWNSNCMLITTGRNKWRVLNCVEGEPLMDHDCVVYSFATYFISGPDIVIFVLIN
jgi:hypothetical protein